MRNRILPLYSIICWVNKITGDILYKLENFILNRGSEDKIIESSLFLFSFTSNVQMIWSLKEDKPEIMNLQDIFFLISTIEQLSQYKKYN